MTRSALTLILAYGLLAAALLICLFLISLAPLRLEWGRELVGGAIAVIAMVAALGVAGWWQRGRPSDPRPNLAPQPIDGPHPTFDDSTITMVTAPDPWQDLSVREREVLRLLCEGQSNKQIARTLQLSENTIKTHLARVYEKLGVNKRTEAMAVAQRRPIEQTLPAATSSQPP